MNTKFFFCLSVLIAAFSCNEDTSVNISNEVSKNNVQVSSVVSDSIECSFDNEVLSLGEGIVIVPEKFEIFNDSLLTDTFSAKNMYSDNCSGICSKFYKPDYGIMHFVCLRKTKNAYEIIVNQSEIKYFPKTTEYIFENWNDYIINSYGIRRKKEQPLMQFPEESSDTLLVPNGYDMFCPIEIKKDWVKVKCDCFYNEEQNEQTGEPCSSYINKCKNPLTGWIRWKKGSQLLVDIFLLP